MAHLTCGYPAWASLFTGVDILRRGPGSISAGSQRTLAEQEWTEIVEAGTDDAEVKRAVAFCCPSVVDALLKEDDAAELAQLLGALADPVRLRLLSLVAARAEICSCDLEAPLGKSQPTVSHHTKVLANAGLLVGEKRGRWVWWRVDPARLEAVRRALGA
jgi:ArsR family transcriptional regulator, arsenate/arsenite/antimonite-responsive transcriptional repressor